MCYKFEYDDLYENLWTGINLLFCPVWNCIHNFFKVVKVKYCIKYNANTKTPVSVESRYDTCVLDSVESSMCGIILRSASSVSLSTFSLLLVMSSLH